MAFADLLDKTAGLQRVSYTKGSDGRNVETFAASVNYPCTLWPADAKTVGEFMQRGFIAQYCIATASDIATLPGDRIIVDGRTYRAVGYQRFQNALFSSDAVYLTIVGIRNTQ